MKKILLIGTFSTLLMGCTPTTQNPQIARIEMIPADELFKSSVEFLNQSKCVIASEDPVNYNLAGSCGGVSRVFRISITPINRNPRLVYNFQPDLKVQYEKHIESFMKNYYK